MSHHDSHCDHQHHHGHSTDDETQEPAAEKKLAVILGHWIKHNQSHVHAYRDWAQIASERSMHDVRARIEEAAELTLAASRKFEEALEKLRQRG
jgi:dTDP-D-glucose 4,6-dehydratase